jgi:hypothetical protein
LILRAQGDKNNRIGMAKMTAHLVVDDTSLYRTRAGSIWGLVYFELGTTAFPGRGWTDNVVAFAAAWLEALNKLLARSSETESVWFFDGPVAIDLSLNNHGSVEIMFIDRGGLKESGREELHPLVSDALQIAECLLKSCRERGWEGNDTKALGLAMRRVGRHLLQE